MGSLIVWSGLLLCVLYACVNNWSSHVPPGSTLEQRLLVIAGYGLLGLACLSGVVGSLG